jgi:23S rRNA (guanine745-N1)-methyltransferase/23S rRNA (guanine748-N1)-methyltransferase
MLAAGALLGSGDTAVMVEHRDSFLRSGRYDFIREQIEAAAPKLPEQGCLADIGGGTGYYSAAVLARNPTARGIVLDASKFAARRVARGQERATAIVADAWQRLPLADSALDLVLNVFAPRNPAEFRRVLKPTGMLLTVTPTPEHLLALISELGLLRVDARKADRIAEQLGPSFDLVSTIRRTKQLELTASDIEAIVGMGPNAWHTDAGRLREHIARLVFPFSVTASVNVSLYRPR